MTTNIPDGFRPFKFSTGFLEAVGPLYGKWDGQKLLMGFRCEMRHCNPGGVAHGGMLATFADMFIPIAARVQAKADVGFAPTVNLTLDYIAPAKLGAAFEEVGGLFGDLIADGVLCLRASGIFKVTAPMGNIPDPMAMFGDA